MTKIVIKQELINIELETFILPTPKTYVLVYVLMIFPKTLAKIKNTNHLKKLFGVSKLVNFVSLKTLKQSPMGKWLTMGAQLNVYFLTPLWGSSKTQHDSSQHSMWGKFDIIKSSQTNPYCRHHHKTNSLNKLLRCNSKVQCWSEMLMHHKWLMRKRIVL